PTLAEYLLLRIRSLFRSPAAACHSRLAIGQSDLCDPSSARSGPLLQLAGQSRALTAVGSGPLLLQSGGLECQHLSGSDDSWPCDRRGSLRCSERSPDCVRDCDCLSRRGSGCDVAYSFPAPDPSCAGDEFACCDGGVCLRLAREGCAGIDLARY